MLIEAEVPNEFVDEVARAVVERVIELIEARAAENEYMDVARAAAYLSCSFGEWKRDRPGRGSFTFIRPRVTPIPGTQRRGSGDRKRRRLFLRRRGCVDTVPPGRASRCGLVSALHVLS